MNLHTKRKVSFVIPNKRSTDLSLESWLTKPSEGVSGYLVRTPFAGTIEPGICIN